MKVKKCLNYIPIDVAITILGLFMCLTLVSQLITLDPIKLAVTVPGLTAFIIMKCYDSSNNRRNFLFAASIWFMYVLPVAMLQAYKEQSSDKRIESICESMKKRGFWRY